MIAASGNRCAVAFCLRSQRGRDLLPDCQLGHHALHRSRVKSGSTGDVDPAKRATERRPQSRRIAIRPVDGRSVGNSGFEQMHRFAIHRVSETVDDKAGKITDNTRFLAQSFREGFQTFEHHRGGLFAADQLQEARREGRLGPMHAHHPFRVGKVAL